MRSIVLYIKEYFSAIDKRVLALVTCLAAILIYLNFHFGLDGAIRKNGFPIKLIAWWGVFAFALAIPYLIYHWLQKRDYTFNGSFLLLLFIAPGIFALKLSIDLPFHFSDDPGWNNYWEHIVCWPSLVIITGGILYFVWIFLDKKQQPFYGTRTKGMNWRPYLLMLLIMLPLVAAASTQPDFLAVYPKIQSIEGMYSGQGITWWHKLLFEISYGSDFITIELFFRGFLVLAFVKWAGKDAILPMACFYCTIHFGKPLGECISSYFGGMILGIIVYNTRSIFGGLIVHLGIAWMMEIGGYIGNGFK